MSYFNTPATYKTEGSVIYPTSHQEYKQKQKSDYGQFNSMEYSAAANFQKSNKSSYPAQYKPNQQFSSWGSAKNNVLQFNPSIVQDGMVLYYSKNNYKNPYNSTSITQSSPYGTYKTESGRTSQIQPETLNQQLTANRSRVSAFPYLDSNYFATAPDFTQIDSKHSQETVANYFKSHNQFQTDEHITPGIKTVKLESGRVITYEIKPQMKDMAACPRPQNNNLEIIPNKYAYNVNEYSASKLNDGVGMTSERLGSSNYPLAGLSGATIPDNMYNKTHYDIISRLNQNPREYKEQSLQQPKLLIPTNDIETIKPNVSTNLSAYSPIESKAINTKESFGNETSKKQSNENFSFNKEDMADELYKQILRTNAKSICDFLLSFRPYKPWMKHWKILDANLKKTNLNVSKLPINDKEIAFTLDKGEIIKFRWEDEKRFVPKDVFMYVLLHELTHEAFPPTFQGHGDPFPQMLCLLCVAATELDILNIQNIPKNIFMSNGRPITSRESIKSEIMFGIDMLIEANKNDEQIVEYYNVKKQYVNKYS